MGLQDGWIRILIISTLCVALKADQIDQLQSQIEAQHEKIRQLEERLEKLQPSKDALRWIQNMAISADLRYRHETIDQDGKDQRNRHRIRARLGINAKVNDQWDLGLRLATGHKGDPVSTNQDLGSSFSRKPIWLDTAFLRYHPDQLKGFEVLAGKLEQAFFTAGTNQLIWDHDLTPEGAVFRYTTDLTRSSKINGRAGAFWVAEHATEVDPALFGMQVYIQQGLSSQWSATVGLSHYDFTHIKGHDALNLAWEGGTSRKFFGNSASGNRFANDYDLLELFAQVDGNMWTVPISLYGSYVINTAAEQGYNEDTGWLVGFTLNRLSNPKDWQIYYDYRDIGADAVVGQFNDSDFIGGGTDGKGHRLSVAYQLAKNVQATATCYINQLTRSSQEDYKRLQLDILVRFK